MEYNEIYFTSLGGVKPARMAEFMRRAPKDLQALERGGNLYVFSASNSYRCDPMAFGFCRVPKTKESDILSHFSN